MVDTFEFPPQDPHFVLLTHFLSPRSGLLCGFSAFLTREEMSTLCELHSFVLPVQLGAGVRG